MVGVCAPRSQQLGALHGFCCGSKMLWPLDALYHAQHFPAQRHLLTAAAAIKNQMLHCLFCCFTKYQCKALMLGYVR